MDTVEDPRGAPIVQELVQDVVSGRLSETHPQGAGLVCRSSSEDDAHATCSVRVTPRVLQDVVELLREDLCRDFQCLRQFSASEHSLVNEWEQIIVAAVHCKLAQLLHLGRICDVLRQRRNERCEHAHLLLQSIDNQFEILVLLRSYSSLLCQRVQDRVVDPDDPTWSVDRVVRLCPRREVRSNFLRLRHCWERVQEAALNLSLVHLLKQSGQF